MKLKIVNKSTNALPEYKTPDSSGMDLRAYLPEGSITLAPMERKSFLLVCTWKSNRGMRVR